MQCARMKPQQATAPSASPNLAALPAPDRGVSEASCIDSSLPQQAVSIQRSCTCEALCKDEAATGHGPICLLKLGRLPRPCLWHRELLGHVLQHSLYACRLQARAQHTGQLCAQLPRCAHTTDQDKLVKLDLLTMVGEAVSPLHLAHPARTQAPSQRNATQAGELCTQMRCCAHTASIILEQGNLLTMGRGFDVHSSLPARAQVPAPHTARRPAWRSAASLRTHKASLRQVLDSKFTSFKGFSGLKRLPQRPACHAPALGQSPQTGRALDCAGLQLCTNALRMACSTVMHELCPSCRAPALSVCEASCRRRGNRRKSGSFQLGLECLSKQFSRLPVTERTQHFLHLPKGS